MFTKHNKLWWFLLPPPLLPFNAHQGTCLLTVLLGICFNLTRNLQDMTIYDWHLIPSALLELKSLFSLLANLMLKGRQVLRYLVPER